MAQVRVIRPWFGVFFLALVLAMTAAMVSWTVAGEPRVGVLTGRITTKSGKPIEGVFVTVPTVIEDSPRQVLTDRFGRWRATGVPVGYHELSARRRGFQSVSFSSGSLREGKVLETPGTVLPEANDYLSVAVNYPSTVAPGARKRLQVYGTWKEPEARVHFAVYPYDIVAARTQPNRDGSYLRNALGELRRSQAALVEWDRTYSTDDMTGEFTGWPSARVPDRPGGYLVVAFLGDIKAGDVLNVTTLAVVVKRDAQQIACWATDLKSGRSLPGSSVAVYENGVEQTSATTDASGLAKLAFSGAESVVVVARSHDNVALSGSYFWKDSSDGSSLIYTDRPIYRPGHTVRFKGIFRRWQSGSYSVRASTPVAFVISNPEGVEIARIGATTSTMGSASGEWTAPDDAPLGSYRVGVSIDAKPTDKFYSASFSIQEYRKPEYSVAVEIPKPYYIAGQQIKAAVRANYYFGAPVAGAEVTYTVYRSQWYFWDYSDDYESWFYQGEGDWGYDAGGYGDVVKEGRGITDDNGELKLEIPAESVDGLSRFVIEARVVDPTMREVTASAGTNVVPAEFSLQAEPAKYVYLPGDMVRFNIKTVDWDHQVVPSKPVDVIIETSKWRGSKEIRRQVGIASAKTDAKGVAKLEWKATSEGTLVFTFRAKDSGGREAKTESSVYVGGDAYWSGEATDPNDMLSIIKDKKIYNKGDTARLVLRTKVRDAVVLITTEGERLFGARVAQLKGTGYVVDVPLIGEYVPNVTVSCTLIRRGEVFTQEVALIISPKTSLLTVRVNSSKSRYKPGEMATYTVQTLNSEGHGVPAEVSLGVVDESIYALRNDSTPDIQKYFWGPRSKQVSTSNSLDDYYYGGVDKFENKVRKYFPDTAYWSPALKTDALGVARVSFRMPDSLTTWRATARAVTSTTQVGSAVQKVVVTKDLIVRLQAPRFFRERDKMDIGLIVHNYTGEKKTVSLRLKIMGVARDALNEVKTISVDNNGVAKAAFSVDIKSPGKATLVAEAVTDDRSAADTLQISMPVYAHGARVRTEKSGDSSQGAAFVMSIAKDGKKVGSSLRIDLTPSSAGALLQGLEYLTRYPWGCIEQTVSSFVPDVLAQRALARLGIPINADRKAELPKMIKSGLKRLREMQHADGSFGWYKEQDPDLFMTAYAVLGLREAEQAGVAVPADILKRASDWLAGRMQPELPPRPDAEDWKKAGWGYQTTLENRAFAVMALASVGRLEAQHLDQINSRSKDLTDFALACVGMAASYSGRNEVLSGIAQELDRRAKRSTGLVFWSQGDTGNSWSDEAASAMAMRVLVRAGRSADQLEPIAAWLGIHRDGGYWTSTRDTAVVILALIEHVERIATDSFGVAVKVNGRVVGKYGVSKPDYFQQPRSFVVASKDIRLGDNRVEIVKQGKGRLYWTASLSYVTAQEDVPAKSGYFAVTRKYYRVKLIPYSQGGERLYKEALEPVKGKIQTGEVIRVQLTVKPRGSVSYVLLDNPLPSGFEVLNPEREYNRYYSGMEIHDERVGLFAKALSGEYKLQYDARAEVPGDLHAMPCDVYSMYRPSLFGRCAEDRLSIR